MSPNVGSQPTSILWRQVWGLAALLAAIAFSLMMCLTQQPQTLQDLGFNRLVYILGLAQGGASVVLEPLIGVCSDYLARRTGHRFSLMTVGLVLTLLATLAIALGLAWVGRASTQPLAEAATTVSAAPWLIPSLLSFWLFAIMLLRVPAIALMVQFAPQRSLPLITTWLIAVVSLVGAVVPLIQPALHTGNAIVCFAIGAICVLMGAGCLFASRPRSGIFPVVEHMTTVSPGVGWAILGLGIGAGIEATTLVQAFPIALQIELPNIRADYMMSSLLLIGAIAAFPIHRTTRRYSEKRMMFLALAGIPTLMGMVLMTTDYRLAIASMPLFGSALALLFITQIPYVFTQLPFSRAGLCSGLYFGGLRAGTAVASVFSVYVSGIDLTSELLLAAVGFLFSSICLFHIQPSSPPPSA
ncbi:hypothetical protein ACQ4M4_21625 [Leptolyngbya sp. AN02str]|uniref:hypothetical protein n=1 Tax=Leptolyngbya sp. AN02str TaxID=3423363 RepID=UPI003D3202BB